MAIDYPKLSAVPSTIRPSPSRPQRAAIDPLVRKLAAVHRVSVEERTAIQDVSDRGLLRLPARSALAGGAPGSRGIHLLLAGWACRYRMLPDGRRRIVAFYMPGDVCDFDILALGAGDQSIASINAVQVVHIGATTLADVTTRYPALERALWSDALMTAAIQRAWTINVGHSAAKQRLAHLLCELYRRSDLVGLAKGGSCDLPLTQFHLGDACAMTAIHINRVLQDLRREGLVSLAQRRLTIHDWEALVALATFDDGYLTGRIPAEAPAATSPRQVAMGTPG